MRVRPLTIALLATTAINAQHTSVLFLGNSYTASNNLPQLIYDLSISLGDTITFDQNTPGGYTLEGHSTNPTTLAKINAQDWDFVVLQEQSQRPSFHPVQVAQDVYPYAESLVNAINANSACTEPLFYMTWGRKNGDQLNCPNYPPVCTYAGMQQRLRESYLEMAQDNNAWCAPVGMSWKHTRDLHPNIELYTPDESHPSLAGSYLTACTFYATIFRKSPVGASFISSLDPSTAANLQAVASSTVLDSLDVWNIGVNDPYAEFTYNDLGAGHFFFISGSTNAYTHWWDFGDGNTATGADVQHEYLQNGHYVITYVATDSCGRTDTTVASLDVFVNSISEQGIPGIDVSVRPSSYGSSLFIHSEGFRTMELSLYSSSGALISEQTISVSGLKEIPLRLAKGSYVYQLEWNGSMETATFIVQE